MCGEGTTKFIERAEHAAYLDRKRNGLRQEGMIRLSDNPTFRSRFTWGYKYAVRVADLNRGN